MEPIDFVVTYLDSSDSMWRRERANYLTGTVDESQNTAVRYRSLETFRFWFRSIEKFAPWVGRIHFITQGHIPGWLNTSHPKLNIVRHGQFIPPEHLPTFSSRAIELNIDKIKGLSDRFVNFNDDMFLTAPTRPEDFFRGNLPVLRAQYLPPIPHERWSATLFWNALAVNEVCPGVRDSLRKALSLRMEPSALISNVWLAPLLVRTKRHVGFRHDHLAQPLTRTALRFLRSQLPAEFHNASSHRFRSTDTVNIWLVTDYLRAKGEYSPRRKSLGKYVELGAVSDYGKLVGSGHKIVCINDSNMSIDFEREKNAVHQAFASLLPDRSQFELE